jgi:threonine/homoserine/homoserine lactone efflux protein
MQTPQIWAFVLASMVIIVVPGVDMALVTRQVVFGRRAALATLGGLLTAGLVHVVLATLGLSAILISPGAGAA